MTDAAVDDDVGFGGMKVAARRVDSQRPAGRGVLLPGREAHGMTKHVADRLRAIHQRDERRTRIAAERIRLTRPVEISDGAGKAPEVMFRRLVITDYFESCAIRLSSSSIAWLSCCFRAWWVVSSSCRCISVRARRNDSSCLVCSGSPPLAA